MTKEEKAELIHESESGIAVRRREVRYTEKKEKTRRRKGIIS
jgi:hypothetical protein